MTNKQLRNTNIIHDYESGKYTCIELSIKYSVCRHTILRVLDKNNIIIKRGAKRKYTVNETFFDEINTEEKAYFLGLLYADGCNLEKIGKFIISLQENDRKILDNFKTQIESNRPLRFIDRQKEKDNFSRKNQICLEISSKKMSNRLSELGCFQRKSLTLKFPTKEQVPEHLIRHFIRGYFDGDGCIYIKDNICSASITSTKYFCDVLSTKIAENLAIACKVRSLAKNTTTCEIRIADRQKCIAFLNWIYSNSKVFLNRKYEKYLSLLHIPLHNKHNTLV